MSRLSIIAASTRPGRVGPVVARWVEAEAKAHNGFAEVEVLDLAEVDLPFMDEPHHPRLARYVHRHTRDWSAKVAAAEAFVFVMPEYNHGYNAELKNAIDYLHHEWRHKPVGLVSYGGVSAGTRATQMITQVVTTLGMTPIPEAVSIPFVRRFVDAGGSLVPNEGMTAAATSMLDGLVLVNQALRGLRTASRSAQNPPR
ncbi:NADPH-dependent FMN reductase [Umezawaea tangerina]|uniref:NAD(P)H-dependent FMN reductase n=1 Tax=Umezawaea tangerina TaxID=84725 RepID=A0A2T0STK5_9PSEU|nr:NAD(P)H-dependent oxidoreductase [Umezawaea tangerina]PRY36744.1 NAD(P)H-dependent FMN reductase [Umezawaea tangerina]